MAPSLPPAIAHKPHKDLTGQATKSSFVGFGGLADVHEGEWTKPGPGQSSVVAIKLLRVVYDRDKPEDWDKMSERLNREAWAWHDLTHPNILPFYGISNDAGGKGASPALISPLCTKGHVLDYLKKNPDVDRLKLAVGVAKGLRYLHSLKIIHGDIKGTNILIGDDCEPLLCDFGRSRIIGHRGFTTRVLGVLAYQAPELIHATEEAAKDAEIDEEVPMDDLPIDKEIFSDKLTTKTDVYAYAMVALEIFTGKFPYYYIVNDFSRAKRITEGEEPQRKRYNSKSLTDARWALLAECWVKDPAARPEVDLILPRLV